jgi:hypothetical protein
LHIVEVLRESHSAHTLGRPIFNDMLERISRGEADGILCWKLDRLARNFIDGGRIIEMIQHSVIRHIRAYDHGYYPTDNVLLMAVELGMANQYSRDLSVNVERGMRRKAQLGWLPVQAPLGYKNKRSDEGSKESTIIKDHNRFDLVRKLWDFMLTGAYTPAKLYGIAAYEWSLYGKSGRKISRSQFYALFTNPFYYGSFEYPRGSGNWYQGKHEPMITPDEYDKVQILLGRKGRPRPKTHEFAFTGSIRCGECGYAITC